MNNFNDNFYNNYNNSYRNNDYGMDKYNNPTTSYKQYTFVKGVEGAKSYPLPPNQLMLLMDSDAYICYMKTTDNIGKAKITYFKLDEISEEEALKLTKNDVSGMPNMDNFASKKDIENINKRLDDILKMFNKSNKKDNQNNG